MKRLKIVLTFALIGLAATVWGQDGTIDKGSGWLYFSGVPGTTPNVSCCAEIAMNVLTREAYVWNRDSTEWELLIELTQGLAAPSGDPGAGPKLFLNRDDGLLYRWTGAAWEAYGSGGALADGDYGHIDVSGTGTVMTIDTGVVGPTQLASTAVTPASYTLSGFTVDADGRITAAASGTIGSGTNGDMATWSGANTLTSQTDAKFIYDNNLAYGNRSSGTNAIWLNDSTLASVAYTAGQFLIGGPSGEVTDTTAAGALALLGALSGSGTSGRVPVRSGSLTMTDYANFLYSGTSLSVGTTNATYVLEVGAGGVRIASGSDPTGAAGVLTNDGWFKAHDGTAFRYWPKADAASWTATYIPFSDGGKLTSEAAFSYNSGLDQLTVGEDIFAETFRTEGGAANEGLWLGSSATISILATGTGGVTNKFNLNVHSAGNEGYCTVQESGGTDIARLGNVPFTTGNTRGVFAANFGGMTNGESVTYTAGMYTGGTAGGSITVVPGSAAEAAHAGALYLRGGQQLATTTTTGNTGNIFIQTYEDNDSTAATTLRTHMVFSSDLGSWPTTQLLQRRATTTGIQELTMESDTIKYRISNIGAISTSTDGSGDVTVTHGMGTTPTAVLVTPTGTTPWIVSVHTIGGTTFKVRFYDAAGAAVTSTAVTATWLGKT